MTLDIIENAGSGGIADDRFDVLGCDAVDDRLHRITGSGSIDQIHFMPILDRDSGRVSQPLGVIQGSTLGDCRTALLARKTGVERRIQKQDTHRVMYIDLSGSDLPANHRNRSVNYS